jgi:hypothetical protein
MTMSGSACTAIVLPILLLANHASAQAPRADGASESLGGSAAPYTATRLLVARSAKLDKLGWLEAETTFQPGSGFSYRILREGGDKGIRNRVLRKVLENEMAMSEPASAARARLSSQNYTLAREADGRQVRLTPKRREQTLIDGVATLDANGGLRRVEGRLAKSPSFWVRSVRVTRSYEPVAGHAMPVHVTSTADVKLAGTCEFSMWIDYTAVDGQRIARATARREPPSAAAASLLIALQQHSQ